MGLSFRYSTVSNLHNNKLEGLYSKIANSIRKLEYKTNSKVREQLKSLDPNIIYDESFKNLIYKSNKTPRYILKKINDSLDKGGEILSSENITLEHIIPENPKPEYKSYFKDNNIIHKEKSSYWNFSVKRRVDHKFCQSQFNLGFPTRRGNTNTGLS